MSSIELPPNIPQDLSAAAFRSADGDAAWPLDFAARVTLWLGENGYAVLGTELWVIKPNKKIVSMPLGLSGLPEVHGNTVNRGIEEAWSSFTRRSASETTAFLRSFSPAAVLEEGDLRFNITWVSEAKFEQLRTQ